MECQVICVSRALGAGGEEVGRIAADKLGFRYADQEIILKAAEAVGVSPETVADAERTPGLIARILTAMGNAPVMEEGYAVLPAQASPGYEALIERVVRETAEERNVVIVAHGASIALAGKERLLRVLVTASPETRAARLNEQTNLDERAAKKAVDESDSQRRDYLRRFYKVREELPTHYDLVLNTDALTPERAAQVIVSAAGG